MKDATDITILLDRSGSMGSIKEATIAGFNEFLKDQQKQDGDRRLTLIQFDDPPHQFYANIVGNIMEPFVSKQPNDGYVVTYDNKSVNSISPLTGETFVPRGGTPLLDSIAMAINETGDRLRSLGEAARPNKVIFVIITDGQENASKLHKKESILNMISHQRSKYNWEFMFLGANQNAIAEATSIGIAAASSMTYYANSVSTRNAFSSASNAVNNYSAGNTAAFTDADYKAQEDAKDAI